MSLVAVNSSFSLKGFRDCHKFVDRPGEAFSRKHALPAAEVRNFKSKATSDLARIFCYLVREFFLEDRSKSSYLKEICNRLNCSKKRRDIYHEFIVEAHF